MDIYINGNAVDVTLEGERTVGDVLKGIEQSCEAQNATIVEIEVDGRALGVNEIDAEAQKSIEETGTLKLRAVSARDIEEALAGLGAEFSRLEQELQNIPALMQGGKKGGAYQAINDFANAIDAFCHVAALSALFPGRFALAKIGRESPQEFFENFSPVLHDFCKALEDNDIVMIGDLAEYEIAPRISAISALLALAKDAP
jgi:hypothetical protein